MKKDVSGVRGFLKHKIEEQVVDTEKYVSRVGYEEMPSKILKEQLRLPTFIADLKAILV